MPIPGRVVVLVVLALWAASLAHADDLSPAVDLAEVQGLEKFPGDAAAKARLAAQGFVVLPRYHKQIFSPYIGGPLPYYVTVDSAHHTYHVLFEKALKDVERALSAQVRRLVRGLHGEVAAAKPPAASPWEEGHALAFGYLAVAERLLSGEGGIAVAASPLASKVAAEVELVLGAGGPATSPLFGVTEDYALYRPRGFYAGDVNLEAYFRAVTWLGRRGFRVVDRQETAAAILLVRALDESEELRETHRRVASILDDLVGPPDDLTVEEYTQSLDAAGQADLEEVRAALSKLRAPEINAQVLPPDAWRNFREETKGLRLLPSRRLPDAWLFQRLNEQDPEHRLPSGLEVALALGSTRAGVHLAAEGAFGVRTAANVRSNLPGFRARAVGTHYGHTLDAAALLFDETRPLLGGGAAIDLAAGAVGFPKPLLSSPGWHDRLLTTGLSAWTSLRHAWVLHAKRTESSLGMTSDPTGVVEPAPRFYAALAELARALVARADSSGAFATDVRQEVAALLPALEKPSHAHTHEDYAVLQGVEDALGDLYFEARYDDPETFPADAAKRLRAWLEEGAELDEAHRAFLDALGAPASRANLLAFAALMDELVAIAEHELQGKNLDQSEVMRIQDYGKEIARLMGYDGNSYLTPVEQMGLVVDVGGDPEIGIHREVAVGAPMELYVVLPVEGAAPRLFQGGVYSAYEFDAPAPLTDAEWQRRVATRAVPPLPAWTSSYVASPDLEAVLSRLEAGEIVDEVESLFDPRIGRALLAQVEAGKQDSSEADRRLGWLMDRLLAYAATDLRGRIGDAYVHWLLYGRDAAGTHADRRAAAGLASLPAPLPHERLLRLLLEPPEGASPAARERIVRALLWMDEPPRLAKLEPLLVHSDAAVRRVAIRLLSRMLRPPARGEEPAVVARLTKLLQSEPDEDTRLAALDALEHQPRHIGKEQAPVLLPLLRDPDPSIRGVAAVLLGWTGAGEAAEALLACLDDTDPRVRGEAAEALGKTLRARDAKDPVVGRSLATLEAQARLGPWIVTAGCLDGLVAYGGEAAAKALESIATDARLRVNVRDSAVDSLGELDEVALPALYRLCFDDTVVEDAEGDEHWRLCHAALFALDKILQGRFGTRGSRVFQEMPSDFEPALTKARAEARAKGYGPTESK